MKAIITFSLLMLSLTSFGKSFEMSCQASHNSDFVLDTKLNLAEGERNKSFGQFEEFVFFASSKNDVIELQSYDSAAPSRTYASSRLTEKGSFVELAVWKREYLLEVRCTLL